MIFLLPGLARPATVLAKWRDLLPGRVEVLDIPGQGIEPPLKVQTFEALVEHFADRLAPASLVVGESLGGLIGLGLAGRGFRAVTFDPPLTLAKQWSLHYAARTLAGGRPPEHPIYEFIANIFGLLPDGSIEERIYYPLLDRLTAQVDVVTGDTPLWPYRGDGFGVACLIDGVDEYVLQRSPNVRFHRIAGAHALLDSNPDACVAIIEAAMQSLPSPA